MDEEVEVSGVMAVMEAQLPHTSRDRYEICLRESICRR